MAVFISLKFSNIDCELNFIFKYIPNDLKCDDLGNGDEYLNETDCFRSCIDSNSCNSLFYFKSKEKGTVICHLSDKKRSKDIHNFVIPFDCKTEFLSDFDNFTTASKKCNRS